MVFEINSSNFEKEVLKSEIPVILDFWAEWSGPCRMMAPVFEQLGAEFQGKLKFAKVNVDENSDIAGKFGIRGIPCIIVAKKGNEAGRIVGYVPKDILKSKIEDILS